MTPWTQKYMDWIKSSVRFEQLAQQWTLEDYINEVEHLSLRIIRLEGLIDKAVETAPARMREVIAALQGLRGIAKVSAVTIVAEVGEISRFPTARQFMGYSGTIPSEHSSGESVRRGSITKTGNSHLRRIVVEAAWSQRHLPILSGNRKLRLVGLDAKVQEIATKAMHRLHNRYIRLTAREKCKQKVVTAVARELLGFIWAIGTEVEKRTAA
jgi:transposase